MKTNETTLVLPVSDTLIGGIMIATYDAMGRQVSMVWYKDAQAFFVQASLNTSRASEQVHA